MSFCAMGSGARTVAGVGIGAGAGGAVSGVVETLPSSVGARKFGGAGVAGTAGMIGAANRVEVEDEACVDPI